MIYLGKNGKKVGGVAFLGSPRASRAARDNCFSLPLGEA